MSTSGGTYTLLVELPQEFTVEVGALGERTLPAGWYAYTGSALGAGGFARIDRHYEVAEGNRDTRHWHVDYLLGHDAARLRGDVCTLGGDIECNVARALPRGPVAGFGSSDCGCSSHLAYAPDRLDLKAAVRRAHREQR